MLGVMCLYLSLIRQVSSATDFLSLSILSQFYHNQRDLDLSSNESLFTPPAFNCPSKIAWCQGHALGFYTLLKKGNQPKLLFHQDFFLILNFIIKYCYFIFRLFLEYNLLFYLKYKKNTNYL